MKSDGTLTSRERRQLFCDIIETEVELEGRGEVDPYAELAAESYVEPEASDAS